MTEPLPSLTRWQKRTRDRRGVERRVAGVIFALLAAAAFAYFGALARLVAPMFAP